MNKSYLIYVLIAIFIFVGYSATNNNKDVKYTKLYSNELFFDNKEIIESTKSSTFGNEDLKGKISLVFFGYTTCPDFCPDTLSRMNTVLNKIENKNTIQLIFVSINPKDSLNQVKKYVEYFNERFIGLTLSENHLNNLAKRTGVYIKKIEKENNIDFYDHTGAIFLVGKEAKITGLYTPPLNNQDILNDLNVLVKYD